MENEELKKFKASLSITSVAKSLGINVEHGRCRCFFPQRHVHGDRTPSVSISEEYGSFRCWVCEDVRGDVISLVQLIKDCSFVDALNYLMETYSFLLPKQKQNVIKYKIRKDEHSHELQVREKSDLMFNYFIETSKKNIKEQELVTEEERKKIILDFLKMLSPVDNTPAGAWLANRRIHKVVWDKMLLRTIKNYSELNNFLKEKYDINVLKYVGLFNDKGNLRYYKHPLIFPYLDSKRRAYFFQARTLDKKLKPKEINLSGTIPYPYNVSLLDNKNGWVYLCEGVVDTLTLLNRKINAIGIPGVSSFKVEWLPLFKNKSVVLCLDNDEAGRKGTKYLQEVFEKAGIRSIILGEGLENIKGLMKEGEDINDWFGGKK